MICDLFIELVIGELVRLDGFKGFDYERQFDGILVYANGSWGYMSSDVVFHIYDQNGDFVKVIFAGGGLRGVCQTRGLRDFCVFDSSDQSSVASVAGVCYGYFLGGG